VERQAGCLKDEAMKTLMFAALAVLAAPAAATGISTHVLDLAKGIGGAGVPVVLDQRTAAGWTEVSRGTTDAEGRIRSFGREDFSAGDYRLRFDMQGYSGAQAFFPEMSVVFRIAPNTRHVHVPLVVSPFGYSTYRGT
jgi:5-hydroxyisourate hydrolase